MSTFSATSDKIGTISQFAKREKVTITTDGSDISENSQITILVAYKSEMQISFDDIRFNGTDGAYINYYLKNATAFGTAEVLIEIPIGVTDPGSYELYMYYGNSDLANGSDADETYVFFDAFGEITNPWVRYKDNPIFTKNPTSGTWDYYFTNSPYIAINIDGTPYQDGNGNYYMYYSGSGNADGRVYNEDRVGLALSKDLVNWTRIDPVIAPLDHTHEGLVLDFGAGGAWDDSDVQIGAIIVKDGTFHMWYTGNANSASDDTALGYASSVDGKNWTKYAGNPILNNGIGDDNDDLYAPYVIFDSETNEWKMWYIGQRSAGSPNFGVMYATAPADEPWNMTKYSAYYVYTRGTENTWGPYVWKDSPTSYHMVFSNYGVSETNFHHATSSDGINWAYDGIIFNGEAGEWDENIYWLSQIQVNGLWYTYYRGDDGAVGAIGLAISNERVPTPATTILDPLKWTEYIVGNGSVIATNGKMIVYSGAAAGNRGYGKSIPVFSSDIVIEGVAAINPAGGGYNEFSIGDAYGEAPGDYITFLNASTTNANWYLGSKKGGVAGTFTQVAGNASYHDFKIIFESTQIRWYIDGVLKKTVTDLSVIPVNLIPVELGARYGTGASNSYLDLITVCKYIANTPTVLFGDPETPSLEQVYGRPFRRGLGASVSGSTGCGMGRRRR